MQMLLVVVPCALLAILCAILLAIQMAFPTPKPPGPPTTYFLEGTQARAINLERSLNPYPEEKYTEQPDPSKEAMRQKYFPDMPPQMTRRYQETGHRRQEWFKGYDSKEQP
jgi:hypothetical protein